MESTNIEILNELKEVFQNIKCSTDKEKPANLVDSSGESKINKNQLENEFEITEAKLDAILTKIKDDSPDYCKVLSMITSILYEKAKICLNSNLFDQSKAYLEKSLNLINNYIDNPQVTFIYLRVVNYLSYVVSRMGEFEKAKNLLEVVVNNELKSDPIVYSTEDLFLSNQSVEAVSKIKLQKLQINNMQMLGWIYGKLGMTNKYARTLHKSLQEELNINDGDPVHWATRCYRLASLFIAQDRWENARYHLAAAQVVLDPLELTTAPNTMLFKAQGDLARVWVNYGLQLFGLSRRSILEKVWDENDEVKRQEKKIDSNGFKFTGMDIHLPEVPTKEINNIQSARELFTHTHKWLKRARLFYTLRDYPLQYVNIILELSELYRYLAFYEKDLDSQYDVNKKRFETLETLSSVLREVRPSCYATMSIEIIREIMDVQVEMMNLNLKKLYNPTVDSSFNESDLKKRMETLTDINFKISHLYNKQNESTTASQIQEGNKDLVAGTSDMNVAEGKQTKTVK